MLTRVCGAAATLRDGRYKGAEFIEDVMPKTLVNIFNIIVYTVVPKHTSCAYLALFLLISLSPAHKRKSREGEAGWVFVETTNRTKSLDPRSPGIPAYFKNIRISLLTRVCGAAATLRGGRDKGAEFIEDVMPKEKYQVVEGGHGRRCPKKRSPAGEGGQEKSI